MDLITEISERKKTEYRLLSNSEKKRKIYQSKQCLAHEKIPIEKKTNNKLTQQKFFFGK